MEIFGPPELLLEEDVEDRGMDSPRAADRFGVTAFVDADFSFLGVLAALKEPLAVGCARTSSVRVNLGAMAMLVFLFFAIRRRISRSDGFIVGHKTQDSINDNDKKRKDDPNKIA
ncbi:hypothetical protein COCNU_07G006790 [Cocos nucifera]|uniref:Uncharacterized protein n=1 Tax=Cocos nucifera TaxID=13894 RepID=A0A8K0IF67_COCNU|nr:hypothetical protein COCNU_07G006790 [Cocos nucifera]